MAPPPKPLKRTKPEPTQKPADKPSNPDRIDDKWRPPVSVTEPGSSAETYVTGKKLGKGGFAVCFEGRSKSTSQVFALKVVKAKVEQKKMMEKFRTELQIHAKMHHPNIVEFLRAFTVNDHTYVVLEMCPNGSLTEMIKARSCLSLPEVRRYMIQICGGVKYMHKRSVIHRDLKMGNIFIDSRMNLKIGDFGLAAVMADEQDRRTTLCGTPNYIAPEILSKTGSRGHDNKVDTWAVGVICYALLIGTPPFQSKTQQEIYTKLRTLEYEWKVDSRNYIPQRAKDFVASCLNLNSAERPDMDQLVDHEFFTMGAIADQLELSCLKSPPPWLENADPRGDRVKTGYGMSHGRICRECGVGTGSDGRLRPAVGVGAGISALIEVEAENREGCAPVIPLPAGILYRQFSQAQAEFAARQKNPLLPTRVRGKKPVQPTGEVAAEETSAEQPAASILRGPTSGTVPTPRPFQSFAAQQRQQALPIGPPRRTEKATDDKGSMKQPPSVLAEVPLQPLLKERPLRAATIRTTRSMATHEPSMPISRTLQRSTTLPNSIEALADEIDADVKRAEKTLGRRYNTISSEARLVVTELSSKKLTLPTDMAHNARSQPLSSGTMHSADISSRALRPTSGNDRQTPLEGESRSSTVVKPESSRRATSKSTSQHQPVRPRHHHRIIAPNEEFQVVPETSCADVLRGLQSLSNALDGRMYEDRSRTGRSIQTKRHVKTPTSYPRVDKWVDYATRHGIAYILSDGSVGMILKSSEDNTRPSSCVVVRNGSQHTIRRARGLDYQFVPQGAKAHEIEFYEQTDYEQAMKRLDVPASVFKLDLDNHPSQVAAANAVQAGLSGSESERMKEVALLDKFGKYMNKQTGACDAVHGDSRKSTSLVHFYQRVGNVGVWRFADGALQFNFPDHTKVTVYRHQAAGEAEARYMVDFVYLLSTDAINLANDGMSSAEALERRSTCSLALEDILGDCLRRTETEIVRTNEVKEKLSWIRAVVGCWIREGGLGMMGEEKLGWSGLQERRDDKKIKLQWVTVGRYGGDGEGAGRSGRG